MAGGYQVGIASETKAFKQGVESGIIEPLEDAQKELVELGRARGPEQLERSMKDAERATEKLGDETKRTARDIEREFRDTYRKVKRASDDAADAGGKGMKRVKEGAQEVTQEVGQNLGEAVSSIRGDMSDLGQVGQDTLGGLAATLASSGPAGIVGAASLAAGAVGLGLVTAELQKQQEEAEKLRDRMSGMYQEAADAGRSYLDTAQFVAEATDVMFNPDRAEEWKQIQEDVNELGLDQQLLIKANGGDLEAIAVVQERINELVAEETRKREEAGAFWGGQNKNLEEQHFEDMADRWQKVADSASEYQQKAAAATEFTSNMWMDSLRGATTVAEEIDEVGNKLYTLEGGKQILISAETGEATDDISAFKKDADDVIDHISGRNAVLRAKAEMHAAKQAVDSFVASVDGTSFRLHGRVTVDGGWNG